MGTLFRTSIKLLLLSMLIVFGRAVTTNAQVAKLQLDQLDVLANRANETVDLKLDERLMQTTAKLFSGKDKDDAEIKEMLKGIKGIYVKSFEFDEAAVAFQKAQQLDPNFALAYWGEAISHNHPLWAEVDVPAAQKALEKLAPSPEARVANHLERAEAVE